MKISYFTYPDGSIQFIARGLPPDELAGYEVDDTDPYIFHPKLPPCGARIYKNLNHSNCCPLARNVRHCTKFGWWSMTAETCKKCHASGQSVPIELNIDKIK